MTKIIDFITIVIFIILLFVVFGAQKPVQQDIINSVSASADQAYGK